MLASELIKKLETLVSQHGDLPVMSTIDGGYCSGDVEENYLMVRDYWIKWINKEPENKGARIFIDIP